MKYSNGDEYEGELDEFGKKNGNGIMKYNNGIIYDGNWENDNKEGKGILCSNYDDYRIFINNINLLNKDIYNIYSFQFKGFVYNGDFKNNKKDGKGILYMKNKNEYFNNNTIYNGDFKDDHKCGYGYVCLKKKRIFSCYWIDDNIIDYQKDVIFYLTNSLFFHKMNFTMEKWIQLIEDLLKGNKRKKCCKKDKIR